MQPARGYTREEIEHYFAPELKKAQEVTNLSHDELLKAMSYFYDGYSFSEKPEEQTRVFSPVSVSLFLSAPEEGFNNYWSNTGSRHRSRSKRSKSAINILHVVF